MTKYRQFTFALTVEDTPNINEILQIVALYPKYAYILHDKDTLEDGTPKKPHYHFYVEFPNPRSFSSIANDLSVASNFISKVYDKKGILQYLTHSNQPDKFRYDDDLIVSNFDINYEIKSSVKHGIRDIYKDFILLRQGIIDAETFLNKYEGDCDGMNFYNKIRTIDLITRSDFSNPVANYKK